MQSLTSYQWYNTLQKQYLAHKPNIRGDLWFIYGSIYAMCVILGASILHYLETPMTPMTHWVSNLGVGPNGSSPWFNYGLMGTAVLYFIMSIFYTKKFLGISRKIDFTIKLGQTNALIAVTGIFILTNNDMVSSTPLHIVGAYMFFVCTPFFTSCCTLTLVFLNKASRSQIFFTLLHVVDSILLVPLMGYYSVILDIPMDGLLGSWDPQLWLCRLFEWGAVWFFFIWILQTGVHFYKYKNFPEINSLSA